MVPSEFDRRLTPRRHGGFQPPVDVFYEADPPRAVVCVELAGIDPGAIELQLRGRELTITGHRRAQPAGDEQRVYQQLEIEHGPFRRVVSLQADVDPDATRASYDQGILRVELPLREPSQSARSVPIRDVERGETA